MIATRTSEEIKEIDVPTPSAPSLFDGLTFPEVPSNAIQLPAAFIKESEMEFPNEGFNVSETTSLLQEEPKITTVSTKSQDIVKKNPARLAALYANEVVIDSKNFYPELPMFSAAPQQQTKRQDLNTEKLDLNASIPLMNSSTYENPNVVNTLLSENAKLNEELQRLRQPQPVTTIQSQFQPQPTYIQHQSHPQQQQITPSYPQNQYLIQDQQQRALQQSVGLANDHPATGVRINTPTVPPSAGSKYVCCGSCQQWLMAPRASTYVVCSGCDAINNCSLAPKRKPGPNLDLPEERALQQSGGSNLPWFLDCFTKPFT